MNELNNKILNCIRTKDIKPIPRSIFLLKNISLWVISLLSIILGSISVGLIAYNMANKDWDIYAHLGESMISFFVSSLPYLWILMIIISLATAIFNIEHSKNGYKYSPLKITIISIIISAFLGLIGYFLGFGKIIDNYLGANISCYQSVEKEKKTIWNQPDKGLFSGRIKSVNENNETFEFVDSEGKIWQIDYSIAIIKGRVIIKDGNEIKIVSQKNDGNIIIASDIRPWGNRGRGSGY